MRRLSWLVWGCVLRGMPGLAQPGAPTGVAAATVYQPYFSADTSQLYALAVAERAAVQTAYAGQAPTGNAGLRAHYQAGPLGHERLLLWAEGYQKIPVPNK